MTLHEYSMWVKMQTVHRDIPSESQDEKFEQLKNKINLQNIVETYKYIIQVLLFFRLL